MSKYRTIQNEKKDKKRKRKEKRIEITTKKRKMKYYTAILYGIII